MEKKETQIHVESIHKQTTFIGEYLLTQHEANVQPPPKNLWHCRSRHVWSLVSA